MNLYTSKTAYFFFFLFIVSSLLAQENNERDTLDNIPVFTLDLEQAISNNESNDNVSGLLSASKDIFVSLSDYNLGAARFRVRGYNSNDIHLFFNGIPANDLESGWSSWSDWGGLNDVVRRQEISAFLKAKSFAFGGVAGAINIDPRASTQRKQIRATITRTNANNYNNRAMLSYSTGMQQNGWAIALSGSRRWAQEGYIPGTTYDAYSYFASVDKKLNDRHLLNFVVLGAPNKRGKQGAAVQEMYDIAGTNFYNPYWGFQNGVKRNSRVATKHQPMGILRHDWTPKAGTTLTTSVNFQSGRNGSTSLDWYNAKDPRPDYYRRLPSFIEDENQALLVEQLLRDNEHLRQVDWDNMYEVNRNSMETIEDSRGIEGNDVTGNRSRYIVLERRYDARKFNFNSNLSAEISEKVNLNAGITYQNYKGENYQLVDDLLGGDYYLDIDRFAERDFPDNPDALQNNIDMPNGTVVEGDRYGYDYDANINKAGAWSQVEFSLNRLNFFVGANASNTSFYRTGNMRNGKFPDSSLGDSETQSFFNYGAKLGANYAINGRNYVFANATHYTRAPNFRNAYTSPRTRDEIVPNLKTEKITSGEVGYVLNSPNLKAKASAFYTQFVDQLIKRSFFHDDELSFVNYIMTDVDKQHVGVEGALIAKLGFIPGLEFQGVASLGQYTFTNRPTAIISQDNNAQLLATDRTVYLKNFYVSGTPQTAFSVGLQYQTSNYLTMNVNFNYFDDIWMDFNPDRRTEVAVSGVDIDDSVQPGTELWTSIIHQEKAPSAYTLDVSMRKSFKIGDDYFIYVNMGVDNILNTNFISNGFEQLRFDYDEKDVDRFPNKYYYARGINYFVNVSFTIR